MHPYESASGEDEAQMGGDHNFEENPQARPSSPPGDAED